MVKFQITGEFITDKIRTLWSESQNKALKFIKETIPELPLEETINIVEGRKKLIGVNDLDLVDDNWKKPEDVPSYSEFMEKAEIAINTLNDVKEDLISKMNYIISEAKHLQYSINNVGYGYDNNNKKVDELFYMWNTIPDHIKIYANNVPEFIVKKSRMVKAEKYKDSWDGKKSLQFDSPSFYDLFNPNILKTGYLSSEYLSKYIASRIDDNAEYRKICLMMDIYEPILSESWCEVEEYKMRLIKEERELKKNKSVESEIKEHEIKTKIQPDKDVKMLYGWISPSGDFYGCYFARHEPLIHLLCIQFMGVEFVEKNDSLDWAEKNNWVRITSKYDEPYKIILQYKDVRKLSQSQLDRIFDYCLQHNKMDLFDEIIKKLDNEK